MHRGLRRWPQGGESVPVIQFDGGEYSVPDDYVSQEVWVRQQDDEIVIVKLSGRGDKDVQQVADAISSR